MNTIKLQAGDYGKILKAGGFIPRIGEDFVSEFDSVDAHVADLENRQADARKAEQDKWVGKSKARRWWVSVVDEDEKISANKESAVDVIERIYNPKIYHRSDMRSLHETDFKNKGTAREGIMVSWDDPSFRITIRGIVGPHNVDVTDSTVELEEGARQFSITVAYDSSTLPTKDDLIDDVVCYDLLRKQRPKSFTNLDTARIPIYPTAKEYFKN